MRNSEQERRKLQQNIYIQTNKSVTHKTAAIAAINTNAKPWEPMGTTACSGSNTGKQTLGQMARSRDGKIEASALSPNGDLRGALTQRATYVHGPKQCGLQVSSATFAAVSGDVGAPSSGWL